MFFSETLALQYARLQGTNVLADLVFTLNLLPLLSPGIYPLSVQECLRKMTANPVYLKVAKYIGLIFARPFPGNCKYISSW